MKLICFFCLLCLSVIPLVGQVGNDSEKSQRATVQLPTDYLQFIQSQQNFPASLRFKADDWAFWNLKKAKLQTIHFKVQQKIPSHAFAIAINKEGELLLFQKEAEQDTLSSKLYFVDEDGALEFYAFSFCELTNNQKTQALIDEITTNEWQQQDVSVLKNCAGSLFNYAYFLNVDEYDDDYSIERAQAAHQLFLQLAEQEHPLAAYELANYYYFQSEPDVEKVIEWREKAVAWGHQESIFQLADFIIDYKLAEITKAIDLLESLTNHPKYGQRSLLKLARIYMHDIGGQQNEEKGIAYTKQCMDSGNYYALADLAFYHYKGKGVTQDLGLAYQLLLKANNEYKKESGEDEGWWDDFVLQLQQEIVQQTIITLPLATTRF